MWVTEMGMDWWDRGLWAHGGAAVDSLPKEGCLSWLSSALSPQLVGLETSSVFLRTCQLGGDSRQTHKMMQP